MKMGTTYISYITATTIAALNITMTCEMLALLLECIRFNWTTYKNQFSISEEITNADSYRDWQKNIFSAYMKICEQYEDETVTIAPKMLYLFGKSRCGKSSTINMMCDNDYGSDVH